jgi:hypothetical protein
VNNPNVPVPNANVANQANNASQPSVNNLLGGLLGPNSGFNFGNLFRPQNPPQNPPPTQQT